MADWDEIKRLAADFQQAQTSDTLQRISERNCIDIVKKLTELHLIELIYTCDGKEFITPAHLTKEIEDEIYVNGGRMHLHDLASNLNVDYQHVENKCKELVKEKPDEYSLVLGQIIHSTYKVTLGKQINDCMLMTGQLSIAEFSKSLDLPSEFLLTIVKEILPKIMDDYVVGQDERTYYTTDMMDRYKSIIAGTLSAISRPTTVASLLKRLEIPERIFMPIVESLIKEGRIDASVENRLFIPSIYAREQNEWINKFYSANSYIDYDVLSRMDIKQPKAFLKKRFPDGVALKTCFVSENLLSQVESLIEESIVSNGFIDVTAIVPSAIECDDIEQMLQDIFKKNKQFSSSSLIFDRTNVCSLGYVATCKSKFSNIMQSKAQEHLKEGKLVNYFLGGKLKPQTKKENPEVTDKKEEKQDVTDDRAKDTKEKIDDKDAFLEEKSVAQIIEEETISKANRKERRDKKNKAEVADADDSDDDFGGKKSKGRKSGGLSGGREVKQKATKKKYLPGNKGNQKANDLSDEESAPTKGSKSNKGRAARRAISPDRPTTAQKSKGAPRPGSPKREPLIFMSRGELVEKLKFESRDSGEGSDEFYELVAESIEDELNKAYENIAKQTLDEYLKAQEEENDPDKGDIDLVE